MTRPATVKCPACGTLNRVDLARAAQRPTCGRCRQTLRLDHPLPVGDAEFDRIVGDAGVAVLVDFYADWCGPCRMMAPALDAFAASRAGEVLVLKLDTDASRHTASRFGIRGIPTLIVFRGGKEAARHVGAADGATLEALVRRAG